MIEPTFSKELEILGSGYDYVVGIDEAGRGPWAGPVVAAAVVLKNDSELVDGVRDSKSLTEKMRTELEPAIRKKCVGFGIGESDHNEIDELGIIEANRKAMRLAYVEAVKKITLPDFDESKIFVIIDGGMVHKLFPSDRVQFINKADQKHYSVAAASVLAKVYRDRILVESDSEFPGYGFAQHKGYGTKAHNEALKKLGPCEIHRKSFKPVLELLLKDL